MKIIHYYSADNFSSSHTHSIHFSPLAATAALGAKGHFEDALHCKFMHAAFIKTQSSFISN
jgi:hypothetical protein